MEPATISTAELADAAYQTPDNMQRIIYKPFVQALLPAPSLMGGARQYDEKQATMLLLIADLVRAGIKLPLAAGWAVSISEQLEFYPSDTIHIEFRRNGRTFCFTTDDAPDAALAAGPARFRVTFDLAGYRSAFREAIERRRALQREAA